MHVRHDRPEPEGAPAHTLRAHRISGIVLRDLHHVDCPLEAAAPINNNPCSLRVPRTVREDSREVGDMPVTDTAGVLTMTEAARELRCSKAHVHNIIHGRVADLPPLPVLRIGRRVLIRHEALRVWMLSVEAREMEAQKLTGLYR